MNPMIRKELRQRMRERRAWLLPALYLVGLGAAVVLAYFMVTLSMGAARHRPIGISVQSADVGQAIFIAAAYVQLAVLLLMAPVFSAGALTIEKEQRTLTALLTSLLTPVQIWWGKWVAAILYQILLLVSALPVLSLAVAFGGVGPREIAIASGSTFVTLASVSAVGLYCSSFFRRSVNATAVTYAVVVVLVIVTSVIPIIVTALLADPAQFPLHLLVPNPFFALSMGLFGRGEQVALWLESLGFYLALALLASALTVRNLARSGDQV